MAKSSRAGQKRAVVNVSCPVRIVLLISLLVLAVMSVNGCKAGTEPRKSANQSNPKAPRAAARRPRQKSRAEILGNGQKLDPNKKWRFEDVWSVRLDGDANIYVGAKIDGLVGTYRLSKKNELLMIWPEKAQKSASSVSRFAPMAFDRSGKFYINWIGDDVIRVFDKQGRLVTKFKLVDESLSVAISVSGKYLFFANWVDVGLDAEDNSHIFKYSLSGRLLKKWLVPDSGGAELTLAVGKNDKLYVLKDWDCILVYSQNGKLISKWWQFEGGTKYDFQGARDIATDAHGHVFVSNSETHRIKKFSADGKLLAEWGKLGSGPGEFGPGEDESDPSEAPSSMAVDRDGNVYAVDGANKRIQEFDSNGRFLREIKGSD